MTSLLSVLPDSYKSDYDENDIRNVLSECEEGDSQLHAHLFHLLSANDAERVISFIHSIDQYRFPKLLDYNIDHAEAAIWQSLIQPRTEWANDMIWVMSSAIKAYRVDNKNKTCLIIIDALEKFCRQYKFRNLATSVYTVILLLLNVLTYLHMLKFIMILLTAWPHLDTLSQHLVCVLFVLGFVVITMSLFFGVFQVCLYLYRCASSTLEIDKNIGLLTQPFQSAIELVTTKDIVKGFQKLITSLPKTRQGYNLTQLVEYYSQHPQPHETIITLLTKLATLVELDHNMPICQLAENLKKELKATQEEVRVRMQDPPLAFDDITDLLTQFSCGKR